MSSFTARAAGRRAKTLTNSGKTSQNAHQWRHGALKIAYLDPDVLKWTIQARHQEFLHRRGGGRQAGQNAHQWRGGAVFPSYSYSWERAFISLFKNNSKLDFF
jgi:hypothetical protein